MVLEFNPVGHEYRADGVKIPSVTQIVSAIYGAFPSIDPEPADRGTYIHELCFEYLRTGSYTTDDIECLRYLQAFMKWVCEREILLPAHGLIGKRTLYTGYAGTPDIVGDSTIIDIKTGIEQPQRDHMQLIGYQAGNKKILTENLYLRSNGTYEIKRRKYNARLWKIFQSQVMILNFTGRY